MSGVSQAAMLAASPLIGQERCESCKFAFAFDKGPMVQCRRLPPKLTTFMVPGQRGEPQFMSQTAQPREVRGGATSGLLDVAAAQLR